MKNANSGMIEATSLLNKKYRLQKLDMESRQHNYRMQNAK